MLAGQLLQENSVGATTTRHPYLQYRIGDGAWQTVSFCRLELQGARNISNLPLRVLRSDGVNLLRSACDAQCRFILRPRVGALLVQGTRGAKRLVQRTEFRFAARTIAKLMVNLYGWKARYVRISNDFIEKGGKFPDYKPYRWNRTVWSHPLFPYDKTKY